MQIPFVNLKRQYEPILSDLQSGLANLIASNRVVGGAAVSSFESSFADSLAMKYTVSCANGTDALEIVLRAWGIGVGDEVIVPANGWISVAETVVLLGATPIFVDNHASNYHLNLDLLEEKITPATKVIIPIHLYGNPVDMARLMKIVAGYREIRVLEDCAQAHGAEIGGMKVGSYGQAAIFSFYPTKNLGALGDAGAIVTNDHSLAEHCRAIANYGQFKKYTYPILGRNSRMDAWQAKILSLKLPYLDSGNQRRKQIADYYYNAWKSLPIQLPENTEAAVWHLFVIQVSHRDQVQKELVKWGIQTEVHYPIPVCQQPIFRRYRHPEGYPNAEQQAPRLLSIPVYPELTDYEVDYIAHTVKSVIESDAIAHQPAH
ncbi:MAG: DegT/DnrJ/EryC1/StrS family aminotransferase [Bacteroidota bacterium]